MIIIHLYNFTGNQLKKGLFYCSESKKPQIYFASMLLSNQSYGILQRRVSTCCRRCNTTLGSDSSISGAHFLLGAPLVNTRDGSAPLSGEVHYTELPQAPNGLWSKTGGGFGCIGSTWGMLPRLARHTVFRALSKCKRLEGDNGAVRWRQKVKEDEDA